VRRTFALMWKEFIHIRRDFRTLIVIFIMPLAMMILFGYALNLEIKHIALGVVDRSGTGASRELVDRLASSGYFDIRHLSDRGTDPETLFRGREVQAVLVIPRDYVRDLEGSEGASVQLLVDGSDAPVATVIVDYAEAVLAAYSAERASSVFRADEAEEGLARSLRAPWGLSGSPIDIRHRVWYNPDMKSSHFMVPGLTAVLLMMICALLTSTTIARERETGTMEQMLVSPVRPLEIVVGKVAPYVLLAFLDGAAILLFGHLWFGVPLRGSAVLLGLLTVPYVLAALGIGLVISAGARTQQVAMMGSLVASVLPSVLLSGFIFPIESMPWVLRLISRLVPARYYLVIIRGIVLKGIGLRYLAADAGVLLALGLLLTGISVRRFRMRP
jgi:ABC-2 type transport system permease protein